jgi:hypothetical protein
MENIAYAFEGRNVLFVSFAKLANRVEKTEQFKKLLFGSTTTKSSKSQDLSTPKKGKISNKKQKGGANKELVTYISQRYKQESIKVAQCLDSARILQFDDFIDLDRTILIIDEVHNLFRPLANQRQKHEYLEKHIVNPQTHQDMKVMIMTATPGDNIPDILKLLNIVRDPTHDTIKAPDINSVDDMIKFKQSIKGLISFFDMSSDLTKFPRLVEEELIRRPMSMKQFERYVEAYKDVKADMKDYDKLAKVNKLSKYWQGARKYSNMLYNLEKGMEVSEFSSKLPALLDNFSKFPNEKHYAYSAFYENRGSSQGILQIARELDNMGYEKLTVKDAKKLNSMGQMPSAKKRYVLAIQSEIGEEGSSSAGKNLHELIKIYNSTQNKDGVLIHIFLASQGFNEGIDLKAVRHIHIFEPLVTMASDLQTIGRARRYCSHADLDRDKGEWIVHVHRYLADLPTSITGAMEPDSTSFTVKPPETNAREQRIRQLTMELEEVKGKRDKVSSGKREEIKKELSELEPPKMKKRKTTKGFDAKNVKNIDDLIREEATEKMKELFVMHLAIKEAAIDCRVLHEFHTKSMKGNEFKCAF